MSNPTQAMGDADRHFTQGEFAEAVAAYDQVIAAHPSSAEARFNRAVALSRQGQVDGARAGFQSALSLRPGWAAAMLALGHLEFQHERFRDAEAWFERASVAAPNSAEAHCNLGLSQLRQMHPRRALPALRRARELAPAHELPWISLRRTLNTLGRQPEAAADFLQFEKASAPSAQLIAAGLETARLVPGDALENRYVPLALDWPYGPSDLDALSSIIGALTYFDVSREASVGLLRTYDRLAQASRAGVADLARPPAQSGENRLRIGYLSADFRHHVMGHIMNEVIERHDRAGFEIRLYSLAPPAGGEDDLTVRLRQRTAGFTRLAGLSDYDAAQKIADDRLHILVDLMTHTSWAQPGILLMKPAPVIVTHLGSHGTVGLRQVDFKITDRVADLDDAGVFQIERPLPMPGCIIPIRQFEGARSQGKEAGASVVFGALSSLQKTSPRCLTAWKRILDRVPEATLLLSPFRDWQREPFLRRLASFEIDTRRVGFLPATLDEATDRGRYSAIDIMLDAFPYTGGDSAACAMAEGVPFVTLCGTRHHERVATSVLTHLGIPDTIAKSEEEYVELAVRLARDEDWRTAVSQRIRAALPGLDASMTAYTRSLEFALREAWRRHRSAASDVG